MSQRSSRKQAFLRYGINLQHPYRISGRNEERRIVAVSLWKDEFEGLAGEYVYERQSWVGWYIGAKAAFIEDLTWAKENLGGLVNVVVSVNERNAPADSVRTADCYARPNLVMRVTYVDVETGAFRLEQVVLATKRAA